jgi:outer membrane immunogenic protein
MKSLLAAVVGVLSLGGISCATAQSRATPASDWTGFYAGAGVGLRSTQIDASTISEVVVGTGQDFLSLACSGGFGFFPSCAGQSLNSTGFRFDPYLGYNWQFATHWLVGLEGDFGIGNNLDTLNGMAYPGGGIFNSGLSGDSFTVKAGWDAGIRARIGYLVSPTFLVYAAGGAAWQRVTATAVCTDARFCAGGLFLSPFGSFGVNIAIPISALFKIPTWPAARCVPRILQ